MYSEIVINQLCEIQFFNRLQDWCATVFLKWLSPLLVFFPSYPFFLL